MVQKLAVGKGIDPHPRGRGNGGSDYGSTILDRPLIGPKDLWGPERPRLRKLDPYQTRLHSRYV